MKPPLRFVSRLEIAQDKLAAELEAAITCGLSTTRATRILDASTAQAHEAAFEAFRYGCRLGGVPTADVLRVWADTNARVPAKAAR